MPAHLSRSLAATALLSMAALSAEAQLAVIDIPAVAQLVQEVQAMEQQLQTAANQLTQAKLALQTMTGSRGMQLLLAGSTRNYLPANWPQLMSAMQGAAGSYGLLAADVKNAVVSNAVLTSRQLSTLWPADQQRIVARRDSSALRLAVAQEALANVSSRFASMQTLIDAISTAVDQKGILDLQARINAELGMLENEQTKLQILHQAAEAQDSIDRQREREFVVAGHGAFANRFQPTP